MVHAFGISTTFERTQRGFAPVVGLAVSHKDSSSVPNETTTTASHSSTQSNDGNNRIMVPTSMHDHIQSLIERRSRARWEGDYVTADTLKEQLQQLTLPPRCRLIVEDLPRSRGGGSTWKVEYNSMVEERLNTTLPSILQLAHRALGLSVSCSQRMMPATDKQAQLQPIVQQATEYLKDWNDVNQRISKKTTINSNADAMAALSQSLLLDAIYDNRDDDLGSSTKLTHWNLVETSLRGRKAADAAFWFALAGVSDECTLQLLQAVCVKELLRFGTKPTCRAKDILLILDRFAAAGLREAPVLEAVARDCLQVKQQYHDDTHEDIPTNLLDLHSDRVLFMLWKFSARQKKQQSFLQMAQKHWETSSKESCDRIIEPGYGKLESESDGKNSVPTDWYKSFSDPTKPLVVDVGCGMGISLLGLATGNNDEFSGCNLLGVDLSGLTTGYAQGMANRWNLSHRLHFMVASAELVLQEIIDSYPGAVSFCLIQFPTPYRLAKEHNSDGNSQLPTSAQEGFMVSTRLLKLVCEALKLRGNTKGRLLLQSNCEDVAVYMRETALAHDNFVAVDVPYPVLEPETDNIPQRTLNWLENTGGKANRAVGSSWSRISLLPPKGCTETEVACRLNRVPIHRCLLKVKVPGENSLSADKIEDLH
ncbi:putative methyltransferase [Nitzschia inconspicua]|uniref:Methyltransferase n=1 Tax=Nitzschia inconspicua TaxID=303405 RepID=A0A9K3LJN6_9STRA|nr:putative methyltransferase [Nitzschia inconspicua]KAG7362928.1 putative methyltransferase [Nitzschia inconspicua]